MSFTLLGILNSQAAGAGGAGAYDLLETANVTSDGQTVSITSIPSDYQHLQIRGVARRDLASPAVLGNLILRLNGDSTNANYIRHILNGNGSSVTSGSQVSSAIELSDTAPTDGETADIFGAFVIDILDYADTNKNTTVRALTGVPSSSEQDINLTSGLYMSTSAITQVEFVETLKAGSRMSLYGIR